MGRTINIWESVMMIRALRLAKFSSEAIQDFMKNDLFIRETSAGPMEFDGDRAILANAFEQSLRTTEFAPDFIKKASSIFYGKK